MFHSRTSSSDSVPVDSAQRSGAFRMAVQPIVSSRRRHASFEWVEFLVRPGPADPPVSPLEFMRALYRTHGSVADIRIAEACLSEVRHLPSDARFSINLLPSTLHDSGFADFLLERLEAERIDPSRLILELVEFGGAMDADAARPAIRRLKQAGVLLALDDFGAGFTALDLVASGQIDFMKLDRSLIQRAPKSGHARKLLRGMSNFAEEVGVVLVAEGVESALHRQAVIDAGIEWMQGFHFGLPYFLTEDLAHACP